MSKVDAVKFVMNCQNWNEVILPIATHKTPGKIVLKNGIRFESPAIYWADVYSIFFMQVYTPTYLAIEKNDIVVDIGANIGVFTLYAASITQNMVYAFEPFPSNFEALQQNIRANSLHNIIPYRIAVSDQSGTELLLNTGVSQAHKLKKLLPGETDKYLEVPAITLQEIMDTNHLEQIDLLKLDCEGSEGLILQSTPKDCLKRIRKISLEFHDKLSTLDHDEIQKLLEDAGFTTRIGHCIEYPLNKAKLGILHAWRT